MHMAAILCQRIYQFYCRPKSKQHVCSNLFFSLCLFLFSNLPAIVAYELRSEWFCFPFLKSPSCPNVILCAKANRELIIANNCVLWPLRHPWEPICPAEWAKCERSVSLEGRCDHVQMPRTLAIILGISKSARERRSRRRAEQINYAASNEISA